ncbi:hypothetical protein H6G89_10610 [Oscillatoria sp. FACHB-1407]|uniref:hypothetical protein n=1 Tax=Oscillatoria sp. FACHB-1407 TaxID=2692847 RepID=UPI00168967B0|nr:hypothetical protein [Oscillatoria sp. FACHB-1407]MBD2461500.1 hypothetical protein [Oscillatoria sp. FACHB-1407]
MSTCSVSQSNVDIDTYFDTLDFDVSDADVTTNLIKASNSECRFQLPVPVYEATHSEIKTPLGQLALEQAAYEVSLLARQLESAPFHIIEPFEHRYPDTLPRGSKPSAILRHSVIAFGLIASTLPVYIHYSQCSSATSCFQQAQSQVMEVVGNAKPFPQQGHRPQPMQMLPNTVSSPQAIAPVEDPFREAVNQAMRAAELTQTATQATEWETVVNSWLEAIRLMNLTPPTNPRYSTAALKVEEYAKNLAYAQRRMREAVHVAETPTPTRP